RAGTSPRASSAPTLVPLSELSPVELALMDYTASLLELFRRESGRPIPLLDTEDLERRIEAIMTRMAESAETGRTLPKASQPNLLIGILVAYASEADSFTERSSAMVPLLLHAIVDALDAVSGPPGDRQGAPVENWNADRIEEVLSVAGDPMRREALAAADRFRTDLSPRLIAAVERVMSPDPDPDSDEDILWVHALFLLAAWQEPAAATLAARFFSVDSEAYRRLPDKFVLDFNSQLMASLLGDNPSRLQEIATTPATHIALRCDAIRALGCLAAWNRMERSFLVEHLRSLVRGGLVQEFTDEWTTLAILVLNAGLRELVPDLETACQQGWVHPEFVRWETLRQLADSPDDRWPQFVQLWPPWSDIAETSSWLDQESASDPDSFDLSNVEGNPPVRMGLPDEIPAPFRAPVSVGRNDPCPCGSGRKFKKCCGA
ncbi:MAG: DUF1186 domain-containing protein, partial [Verrucomicrobia bacterium]|nr:DUF1186 domain-containing protein [Verrucomicrobiota bacterium]